MDCARGKFVNDMWREPVRARVVRVCAAISGDRDAAEDLAQETLLEAWRNAHKLRDPGGADRWLAAIARNVCLRWARRRGRDLAALALDVDPAPADPLNFEAELERAELVELLDRALSALPPETRDVLVDRYVHESPHAQIGERLGLSADAVSMRLSRGKAALRRVLASSLPHEAAAYGLVEPSDGWRATRLWCPECGRHCLDIRREPAAVAFRCRRCTPEGLSSEYRLDNPVFVRLVGSLTRPTAIRARAAEWAGRYFAAGTEAGDAACTCCDRRVTVRRYVRDRDGRRGDGLFVDCGACGGQVSSSAGGLALAQAELRRFKSEHRRTRALPTKEIDFGGVPALVVAYQSILGSAAVSVVFARDTLRVLAVPQ